MMRLLRVSLVGGSAPNPPGFFRFFSARMGAFVLWSWGAAVVLPPRPVPAAAPVARVASQQSPIPSDGGRLIINPSARALNEKAANGDSPLNFVSHAWGSPHPEPVTARRLCACGIKLPCGAFLSSDIRPSRAGFFCMARLQAQFLLDPQAQAAMKHVSRSLQPAQQNRTEAHLRIAFIHRPPPAARDRRSR